MAEPILKWAGGKRQLLSQIRGFLPPLEDIEGYHEPFFGGGALFFRECHAHAVTINDVNNRLMNFYRVVRDNPEKLIAELAKFKEPTAEPEPNGDWKFGVPEGNPGDYRNYYYQQRARYNRRPLGEPFDETEEAALLLYLNRTCYNGLYRENQDGEFNVPCGSYTNPNWEQRSRIREASPLLAGVEIHSTDFSYITDVAKAEDVVYFDPPYDTSGESTFAEYSSEAFGKEEQERLRDDVLTLHDQGVDVVISNAPSVGELYEPLEDEGFRIKDVGARRAINSDGQNRDAVNEIIITNVDEQRARDTHLQEYSS
jgi:DNA adenine methylase